MNAHHDRSTIRRPGKFRSHLSPVTGWLTAILALGLTHTPQGSAQTLRALPAPPVAQRSVDSTIQVLTEAAMACTSTFGRRDRRTCSRRSGPGPGWR